MFSHSLLDKELHNLRFDETRRKFPGTDFSGSLNEDYLRFAARWTVRVPVRLCHFAKPSPHFYSPYPAVPQGSTPALPSEMLHFEMLPKTLLNPLPLGVNMTC
jgi:hypothetical protein